MLPVTIKCLMTHLLDVMRIVKLFISAMSCVDKIEHAHQIFSDILDYGYSTVAWQRNLAQTTVNLETLQHNNKKLK